MRKDSPLAEHEFIQPQDLWGLPLISSKQRSVDNNISKWIKRDYEKLNVIATYNLIFNATLMVEKGIGYALCLDRLVNTAGNSTLCFRPLKPKLEANVDIVWKKYQVFSKAADLFLQRLKKLFDMTDNL